MYQELETVVKLDWKELCKTLEKTIYVYTAFQSSSMSPLNLFIFIPCSRPQTIVVYVIWFVFLPQSVVGRQTKYRKQQ